MVSVPRQNRPNRVLAVPVPRCFSDACEYLRALSGHVQEFDDRPWVPFGQQIDKRPTSGDSS